MILTADRKYVLNGVTVNEFLITDHNDNRVPIRYNMKGNRIGITVHNTPRLSKVAKTQAEQYARVFIELMVLNTNVAPYTSSVRTVQ